MEGKAVLLFNIVIKYAKPPRSRFGLLHIEKKSVAHSNVYAYLELLEFCVPSSHTVRFLGQPS